MEWGFSKAEGELAPFPGLIIHDDRGTRAVLLCCYVPEEEVVYFLANLDILD